jgi:hypothetical protein
VAIFHDLIRVIGVDVKLSDSEVRTILQEAFQTFEGKGKATLAKSPESVMVPIMTSRKGTANKPAKDNPQAEAEFKVKPPKKLYRGEFAHEDGTFGFGTFNLGKGLYSTFTKEYAKKYGKVKELTPGEAFPKNPLVLRPFGDPKGAFADWALKESGIKNIREFNKEYPDPGEFVRSKGYDGVIVGDEIVKYNIPPGTTPKAEADVLYHGGADLGPDLTLKTGMRPGGGDSGAIFLTPSLKYAKQYSQDAGQKNVYSYALQGEKIFDITKPEDTAKLKDGFLKDWEEEYSSKADALKDYEAALQSLEETVSHGAVDWATASQYIDQIEKAGFDGAKFLERPGENITQKPDGSFDISGPPVYSYAIFKKELKVSKTELPNPSRPPEAGGPKYAIRKLQDPPVSSDPKVLNRYLKDETESVWGKVKGRLDDYNVAGDAKNLIDDIKRTADEYLGAISTRLGNIHPSIKNTLRKFEFKRGMIATERVNKILPFIEKVSKMTREDKTAFDLARKNSDTTTINSLVKKYGLGKEYRELRLLLNNMYEEATSVGYDIHKKGEYHPRVLKDSRGFLEYFYNQQNWPVLQDAIRAKESELQRYLGEDEKAKLINNLLRGFPSGVISLSKPGQLKERSVKEVTPEISKFYMDSDAALLSYINSVTDAIEARRLFGKSKDNAMPLFGKEKSDYPMEDTIGGYVLRLLEKGTITPAQEQELKNIFAARFNETGTRGMFSLYKNISYIDTMGSPTSAITQIGDLSWALYKNGLVPTLSAIGKAITGKSRFRKEDLGIERIAVEFSDSRKSSLAVAKVFKWVGLEKMDNIGKEALINSSYEAAHTKAVSDPASLKKKLEPVFGNETDKLINDLKNNNITENVKLYLFNELSDFQPISLSEMPQKYLTGGNGRIFYMLKTFTLKQFDIYRREIFQKIANKGTRTEGIKNLIFLTACFMVANAGADELKDLLLGRKTNIKDRTVDNLLRLFGISKFVTWKARTEGVGSAMVRQIMPPFKAIDAITKDIATAGNEKGLEITQSIPVFGKLYYWWFGKGGLPESRKYIEHVRSLNKHEKEIKRLKEEGKSVSEYIRDNPETRYLRAANRIQANVSKLKAYRKKLIKRVADGNAIKSVDDRINAQMGRLNAIMAK